MLLVVGNRTTFTVCFCLLSSFSISITYTIITHFHSFSITCCLVNKKKRNHIKKVRFLISYRNLSNTNAFYCVVLKRYVKNKKNIFILSIVFTDNGVIIGRTFMDIHAVRRQS